MAAAREAPPDWLTILTEALAAGESVSKLSARTGLSRSAINRAEKATGIELVRAPHNAKAGAKPRIDWVAVLNEALANDLGPYQLASKLGVATISVTDAERKYGVSLPRQVAKLRKPK